MAKIIVDRWWEDHGSEILLRGKVKPPLEALVNYITSGMIVLLEEGMEDDGRDKI